jgi:molybdopterin-guanine dinucleotide biosynthesis protein A
MRIAGVIVAGGRSSRMGEEKALTQLNGRTILAHITNRIAPQVATIVINANGDAERFADTRLTVLPDRDGIGTPLAGLHAALHFGRRKGFDAVLTVPSDAPFLPHDLVQRLASAKADAAIAKSGGQTHFLTGLWSHVLLEKLERSISDGVVRVKDWAFLCGAVPVEWPTVPFDPFFNVNTPEDLAEAEQIEAKFRS